MGCCSSGIQISEVGLLLPQEDADISQLQKSHPFHRVTSYRFCEAASQFDTADISRYEFNSLMFKLNIDHKPFYQTGPLKFFLKALLNQNRRIDLKNLVLSGILLSRDSFQHRMNALLTVYSIDNKISIGGLKRMVEGISVVATEITPKMYKLHQQYQQLESYIGKIRQFVPQLSERFIWIMDNGKRILDKEEVMQKFNWITQIQKIAWTWGFRLLLIEEDMLRNNQKKSPHKMCRQIGQRFGCIEGNVQKMDFIQ